MELLFESRLCIGSLEGKMVWVQGRPSVRQEPVLDGDSFVDGTGVTIYGSVLHDGGTYRMWYQAWPRDWTGQDVALVGYAESHDGVAWKKRDLGLCSYGPGDNNLTDMGFHSPSVFIDPDAPGDRRYRAVGYTGPRYAGAPQGLRSAGYYTAHSADGLSWSLDSTEPTWPGGDVVTAVYHPGRNRGLVALKLNPRYRAIPRRSLWQAELRGGAWSEAHRALVPDDFDDVAAAARGFASGDYYGMAQQPAAMGTVGFVWQFRHTLPRTAKPGAEAGVFGSTGVTLAFQEGPGDCWQHAPGRRDFVACDAFPWARGGLYTASTPIEAGDMHRLYVCGARETHGWYVSNEWKVLERWRKHLIEQGFGRITFVEWPKWRLFGYRADPEGILELRLEHAGPRCRLRLNYECEPGGSIRVEAPGIAGRGLEDSVALTGGSLSAPVAWRGGEAIQRPADGPQSSVKLHMERATVWAFETEAV